MKLNKKQKKQAYKKSLHLVAAGLLLIIPTGYLIGEGIHLDFGRKIPSSSILFLISIVVIGSGFMKAFLTFLAFSDDDET